ncbi:MAG: hypothetical protein RL045_1148 [Bacteroidota bacterium]|jgi:hypothetical protein
MISVKKTVESKTDIRSHKGFDGVDLGKIREPKEKE